MHIVTMQARLRHRGPDDEGVFIDPASRAALAHTRLAIQDLSPAGHQPMMSADGRFTIVFNGEIYNFLELRKELEKLGEQFVSRSDTEVVLRLYAREGPQCVERLDGMFALAIWDDRERACFLARDPLGIKPLYVWRRAGSMAFASELRALMMAELGPKSLCSAALYEYFLYGSVQEPRTLVKEIEVLPPGHWLMWRQGSGQQQCYWQLKFGADSLTRDDAIQLTREALDDSIRRHFVSDVPVGVFLSGGIDSTAIVALAKANGGDHLRTLSISFDDPKFDEGAAARATATRFGTEHHEWRMTAGAGRQLLLEFLQHVDQPSNDGFNTFCISKIARANGLKVVLSGLGGDELFGGYKGFRVVPKMMAWHRRLSAAAKLRNITGRWCAERGRSVKLRRLSTYLASAGGINEAYWAVRGFFTPHEAKQLTTFYQKEAVSSLEHSWFGCDGVDQPTLADTISHLEISKYMLNQLLRDSDVMSMAWGLELRVPLVDRRLIDQIGRVPASVRLAAGKRLLLDAVPEIPEWLARQPKRGFVFPFADWISQEWSEVFTEIDRRSPVKLVKWYRQWVLFALNHFLRDSGIAYTA